MPGIVPEVALTEIVTSEVLERALSLAVSRNTYVPAAEKLAVVFLALALPNATVPGPLTFDQVVVRVPGGFGKPSSVAVPLSVTEDDRVMV